jgi:hypothetical protein
MNSHKSPLHESSLLRGCLPVLALAAASSLAVYPAYAGKKAPEVKPATQYTAFDSHANEKVAIAIDPCTEPKDCDFFRLPYVRHSLVPVRVIITNDSDTALDLNEVRMQFISANRDKLPAANLEDLNRRLFSTKQAKGTRIPLIPIPIHHAPIDKKITQDDDDFGFKSTTVAPHSTLGGYLFYDVKDLDDPNTSPLRDAEIYVKMIHFKGGKELFAFSIPFNKWLNATAKTASKPAQTGNDH